MLSDLLVISTRSNKWLVLDKVANPEQTSDSTNALVAAVKRAGLQAAYRQLAQANEQLLNIYKQASHPESFCNQLIRLRQRWRMCRTPSGAPVGDLSFCSNGSRFFSQRPPVFEVHPNDSQTTDSLSEGGIRVVLPPGLEMNVTLSLLLSDPDDPLLSGDTPAVIHSCRSTTVSMDSKLDQAQRNLFFEELFATMANDALQQRVGDHQVIVTRDSLTCRLSTTNKSVLTLSLSRSRVGPKETSSKTNTSDISSLQQSLSRSLLISSLSLLRQVHNDNVHLATLPTTSDLLGTSADRKPMLAQILSQAKYLLSRRRIEQRLNSLANEVRINYAARLAVHWSAIASSSMCTARLTVSSPGYDYSRTFSMLIVEADHVKVVAKDGSVFELDDEFQLLKIHVGELVNEYFVECGQRMASAAGLVPRNQRSAAGLSSIRMLTVTHPNFAAELVILLSPDSPPQVRLRKTFFETIADRLSTPSANGIKKEVDDEVKDEEYVELSFLPGSTFQEKLQNLLSIFSLKASF